MLLLGVGCDELAWPLYLPYSVLTDTYHELMNALATMSEILVWESMF